MFWFHTFVGYNLNLFIINKKQLLHFEIKTNEKRTTLKSY